MSRFKCLTLCETATILMTARINDKSLSLDAFSNLMNLKNEAAKFSAGNSELQAYYEKLEEVLNSLSDNHTVISKKTEMNEEIFYTLNCIVPVGEYIVMCGDNDTSGTHITVLQRLNDEWQYCAFSNCGRIFARRSNLSAIYKKFFWSYKRNEPDIYFMLKLRDGFVDAVIPELT